MRASHDLMAGHGDTRQAMIEKLKAQIDFLYKAVHKANQYFWPAFIDPTDHLLIGPPEEWGPGAIDFIKAKVQSDV